MAEPLRMNVHSHKCGRCARSREKTLPDQRDGLCRLWMTLLVSVFVFCSKFVKSRKVSSLMLQLPLLPECCTWIEEIHARLAWSYALLPRSHRPDPVSQLI